MMRRAVEKSLAAIDRGVANERYRPSPVVDPRVASSFAADVF
jgi:hypothetical protein